MFVYEITPGGLDYFKELDSVIDKDQTDPNDETLRHCLLDTLSREYLQLEDPEDEWEYRIIRGLRELEREGLVIQRSQFSVDSSIPQSEDLGKYN